MTEGHWMERVFIPRPYKWVATYGDIIAQDWQFGTVAQFQKAAQAAIAEEA